MIERSLRTIVGTYQLSFIMGEAVVAVPGRILLICARVLVDRRPDELTRLGIPRDRYDVTTPQMFMRQPDPAVDLIVVDEVHMVNGKFAERLRSIKTPVWRRMLIGEEKAGMTSDELIAELDARGLPLAGSNAQDVWLHLLQTAQDQIRTLKKQ